MNIIDDVIKPAAYRMRLKALEMAYHAGANGAHLGGGLSCIEIFATLYKGILKYKVDDPAWEERDRVLVSKAHCVLAYYTALAEAGFLTQESLDGFEQDGSDLPGHPLHNLQNGIEYSGGSLGMAFSVGLGMALDAKRKNRSNRVYVILGDGECDEGSNWEAFMSAAHYQLNNVTVIIDQNQLQYDGPTDSVMNLTSLKDKISAFGWDVKEVDGHNVSELYEVLNQPETNRPRAIIAKTIKGKGVSFMEGVKEWHHGVLSEKLYKQAIEEVLQCSK